MISRIFAALLILSLCLGCSKKEEPAETDAMRSYRLIDSGRVDEAIELLERKQLENPEDIEVVVILASAYARKGGIGIRSLAPVVFAAKRIADLKKLDNPDQSGKKKKRAETPTSDDTQAATNSFKFFEKLSAFWSIYAAIPKLKTENEPFLLHAIGLLDDHVEQLSQGDHVYRAVLKTVYLKTTVENELMTESEESELDFDLCKPNFERINSALQKTGPILIDILDDLVAANPSKKEALLKTKTETLKSIEATQSSLAALSSGDNSIQNSIRSIAIERGFGQLLQCPEN